MVKIIKEGTIKHYKTCDKCDCQFEFDAEDVTDVTIWDDHGGHYPAAGHLEIECPFCKRSIYLNKNEFEKAEQTKFKKVNR